MVQTIAPFFLQLSFKLKDNLEISKGQVIHFVLDRLFHQNKLINRKVFQCLLNIENFKLFFKDELIFY